MSEDYVTRAEHNEFGKRIQSDVARLADEDKRQNERIAILERQSEHISELTASMAEMSVNVKNMCEVMQKQDDRLQKIEARDGEKWRQVVGYVITAVIGVALGFIFTHLGLG